MSTRMNATGLGLCLATVLGVCTASAPALIGESDQFSTVQDNFDPQISNADLINRGQASFANTTGSDIGWPQCGPDLDGVSGTNDGEASNEDGGATGLSKVGYYT